MTRAQPTRTVQLVLPPPRRPDTGAAKFASWPQPIALLALATYLQEHNPEVEVEILDACNMLDPDRAFERLGADLVGICTTAGGFDWAIRWAEEAKRRGSRVVMGGATATALSSELLRYHPAVDAVVRFDGEQALSRLVAGDPLSGIPNLVYRERGRIRENPIELLDLDSLPIPNRSLVDMPAYFANAKDPGFRLCDPFEKPANIISQRGCIWRAQPRGGCVFCSIPYKRLRSRDPGLIWAEVRQLVDRWGVDILWDPSDNLVGDKAWFRRLCAAKPPGLDVAWANYVDARAMDEQTGAMLAAMGTRQVFVGMESGDGAMLRSMSKRSTVEQNLEAMRILQRHNISVVVGVVSGVPGESIESLDRTVAFMQRIAEFDNLDRIEWGSLIPFPGSRASAMLRAHPDLIHKYRHFGDRHFTRDLVAMTRDWYRHFCEVELEDIQTMHNLVVELGLVPYEMTTYQRRSWTGTPSKVV